jgi:hypothetical protein
MISIYRNQSLPLELQLDAAKAAMPFENPGLSSTKIEPKRLEDMTDDELAAFLAREGIGRRSSLKRLGPFCHCRQSLLQLRQRTLGT